MGYRIVIFLVLIAAVVLYHRGVVNELQDEARVLRKKNGELSIDNASLAAANTSFSLSVKEQNKAVADMLRQRDEMDVKWRASLKAVHEERKRLQTNWDRIMAAQPGPNWCETFGGMLDSYVVERKK